jgi:hypothetical protein
MARPQEIPAGDIGTRYTAIQRLIAASHDEAFDKLIDFAASFGSTEQKRETILLSQEFFEYRRAQKQEIIELADYIKMRKKTVYRALELMDEIVAMHQVLLAA